jgi:hypothetical protein
MEKLISAKNYIMKSKNLEKVRDRQVTKLKAGHI